MNLNSRVLAMSSPAVTKPRRIDGRWPSATMSGVNCVVLALVGCAAAGVDWGGPVSLTIASIGILVFGLPHGSLDIALLRRGGGVGIGNLAAILAVYIGVGLAMGALWWVAPTLALGAFLIVAVLHFAEDWSETGSPFLAIGMAVAVVAAPALLHRTEVGAIFVALTGTRKAAMYGDLMLLAAPIGCSVAVAGILALVAARQFDRAAVAFTSLAALIALPPALGFAIFFGLFHSPRHLGEALRALALPRARQWLPLAVPTMLGATGLVVLLYRLEGSGMSEAMGLTSATFMALSILTVPHMAVPKLVVSLGLDGPSSPPAASRAR